MNRTRTIFVVLGLIGLMACASQPAQDHYYSLVLAADDEAAPVTTDKTIARLIVGPVQLPLYLSKRGLPIQIGPNQIRTANHHFWAEPLDEAIIKVLVRDISQLTDAVAVDRDAGRWTAKGDCRLRVEFDKFHATGNSRVVSRGRYWLHDDHNATVMKEEFDIVLALSADGYAHAVDQMRASLAQLAYEIVEHIDTSKSCLSAGVSNTTNGNSIGSGVTSAASQARTISARRLILPRPENSAIATLCY